MKDIINHYRTLVGEALIALDLGHAQERIEEAAYRLGKRIKPEPVNPLEGWQDIGWLDETGARELYAEIHERTNRAMAEYFRRMDQRILFGDTPSAEALRAFQAPKVERAEVLGRQMAESIRPAVERLLGEGKVEWKAPEVRNAEVVESIRKSLNLPDFTPPKFDEFPTFDAYDGFGDIVRQYVEAVENYAFPPRVIVGLDPEAEWVYLQRSTVESLTIVEAPECMLNTFHGISIFEDPDDESRLRMRADDLRRHPNGPALYRWLTDGAEASE